MEKRRTRIKIISLIGYHAEVKSRSGNSAVTGIIVDETKNTILIKCPGGKIKRFPKNAVSLTLLDGDKRVCVHDGSLILGTPWERVKRLYHRWAKPR